MYLTDYILSIITYASTVVIELALCRVVVTANLSGITLLGWVELSYESPISSLTASVEEIF